MSLGPAGPTALPPEEEVRRGPQGWVGREESRLLVQGRSSIRQSGPPESLPWDA